MKVFLTTTVKMFVPGYNLIVFQPSCMVTTHDLVKGMR